MNCGSKDSNKDLITNLALAQILAGSGEQPQGKAEFRLSNTNALLSRSFHGFSTIENVVCYVLRIYRETILKITGMVSVTVLRIIL